jgi:hypothetical protein
VKQLGSPAYSQVLDPCCSRVLQARNLASVETSLPILFAADPRGRGPDIHVDGIWLPQEPPQARARIVSPAEPLGKSQSAFPLFLGTCNSRLDRRDFSLQ